MKLHTQSLPKEVLQPAEQASPRQFALCVMARQLTLQDSVDKLLAQPSYEDKIRILNHQTTTALTVLNNFSYRALLADEVGLGKTIETGIIVKEFLTRKLAKKVLILTPATLKYQWQEEMRSKFGECFEVANDPSVYDQDLVIASIDTAKTKKHLDVLKNITWDLIVVDEAHKLKNAQTQNYKLVKSLNKKRMFMLTATPLQNNLLELWALLDLLHPGFLGTKAHFTDTYLADKEGLQVKNNEALQEKLGKIMIRNLRRDTGIKFADRKVSTHLIEFTREEQQFYEEVISFVKQQYLEIKEAGEQLETDIDTDSTQIDQGELKKMAASYRQKGLLTFGLIMLTRQLTSSLKTGREALKRYKENLGSADEKDQDIIEKKKEEIDHIIEKSKLITADTKMEHLLKLLKNEKEKVIIFTTFVHTQQIIAAELAAQGFSTVSFHGGMTPEEKEAAIAQFKGDKQVLICTDAGSEGRNLQFAHILINYDLPWNPMRVEQRIGRVHRIGQERDVIIHNIAVKDTIESYILNRLYEKINLFNVAIGEMDLILSQLKDEGNFEQTVFGAAIGEDDKELDKVEDAKKESERIKDFDNEVFGGLAAKNSKPKKPTKASKGTTKKKTERKRLL